MANRRILAATDLTEPSDEALRQASEWARLRGAELFVCHVAPSLVGSNMLFPQATERQVRDQPRIEARIADAVSDRSCAVTGREATDFHVIVAAGTPYAEIVRQAEELRADLVVVGSHSRSGLAGIFLGNTAEEIVRHAHTSVLLARPRHHRGRIVVATDLSDAARTALRAAAEQARLSTARITLMYSIHKELETALGMSSFGSGYQFMDHERGDLRTKAEQKLRDLMERADVTGDAVVTEGAPAAELVQLADELGAELAVVGATGRTALRRMHIGKVAERIVRHAPCSVLVVR
ncbi:MAG TPA: universal stress protein [Polyangia bacterium]|nr:universal stress protein [Polyangia bacterium]